MFEGGVQQVVDGFEIAPVFLVISAAQVNDSQKVHDVGGIFNRQMFG